MPGSAREIDPHIVILASDSGKRMNTAGPKVLHHVLFRPLIHYVLDLAFALPHQSISVVVGKEAETIENECHDYQGIRYFRQQPQDGTAHAVKATQEFLKGKKGRVLVLNGDGILFTAESLSRLIERHDQRRPACTVATTVLAAPQGYGRILGSGDTVTAVREEADCTPEEREIREVNAGAYCFEIAPLFDALSQVSKKNAQNEYYLTETIDILSKKGGRVEKYGLSDPDQARGINDLRELGEVESVLQGRINASLMAKGVALRDSRTIFIDPRCKISKDVRIEGGSTLINSVMHAGAKIENFCRIIDSEIGRTATLRQGTYLERSFVGRGCVVGPYAHLRPGTHLEDEVRIGNFVEVKNAIIGAGTRVLHLSFIGDAQIGKNVNIGCGFVTCNSDGGPVKQRTVIEDDVFVGSDSQAVAPVRLGSGSFIATGTTITEDVPPDSFVISRGRQVTKAGYAKKYRKFRRTITPHFAGQ